jgi:phosphoribosylformylglycinamidine synthase subunit PurS
VSRKYGEMMKVKVLVMPKAAVLDPQGNAVRDAMRHLGMPEVRSVRIGKYMEIEVDGENGELESRLHGLCRDLLSNPVIEDYELEKAKVLPTPGFGVSDRRRKSEVRLRRAEGTSQKSKGGGQRSQLKKRK